MRIAVDARPLSHPLAGIGRYTQNVLAYLLRHTEHQWFIYSDSRLIAELPKGPQIHYRTLNKKRLCPSTIISQLLFPIWAAKDRIELFWSPGQHLPLLLSAKIKTIVTIHDLVWLRYPETMNYKGRLLDNYLIPASINKANHILSVSHNTRDELINNLQIPPGKVTVTTLAPTPLPPGHKPILIDELTDARFILFVGTQEPRKNLNNLLIAYSQLQKCYPDHKLVICGQTGWLNTPLHKTITELDLSERVVITGYLRESELHGLYQHTDVLAMPSLYEGFGLPALEAMAYNKPVVVTPNTEITRLNSPLIYRCSDCKTDSIYKALLEALMSDNSQHNKLRMNWRNTSQETLDQMILYANHH
jgi:glycosyltransferase involved in cell wall biosynthesis